MSLTRRLFLKAAAALPFVRLPARPEPKSRLIETMVPIEAIGFEEPKVERLRPYSPWHDHEESVVELMKSMRKIGLLRPLLVDCDLNIIDGHCRLEAAKRLGWDLINVTIYRR